MLIAIIAKTQPISASRAGLGSVVVTDPRGFISNVCVVSGPPDAAAETALHVDADVFFAPTVTAIGAGTVRPPRKVLTGSVAQPPERAHLMRERLVDALHGQCGACV